MARATSRNTRRTKTTARNHPSRGHEEPETLPLFGDPPPARREADRPGPEKVITARKSASKAVKLAAKSGSEKAHISAQASASKQREISVSEFFAKNRHMLGFDSPSRAILTAVKEAVDNSLDACEEAGLLPDILVEIAELSEKRYRVVVEDSGPGIVKAQVPRIFGKLLYGSKFHELKQSRGQQGIGISAAVMYAQLTTGKTVKVTSRTGARSKAHLYEIQIDTKKNTPVVLDDGEVDWERKHGTRIEMEIEATYKKGRRSVDTHIHLTDRKSVV